MRVSHFEQVSFCNKGTREERDMIEEVDALLLENETHVRQDSGILCSRRILEPGRYVSSGEFTRINTRPYVLRWMANVTRFVTNAGPGLPTPLA